MTRPSPPRLAARAPQHPPAAPWALRPADPTTPAFDAEALRRAREHLAALTDAARKHAEEPKPVYSPWLTPRLGHQWQGAHAEPSPLEVWMAPSPQWTVPARKNAGEGARPRLVAWLQGGPPAADVRGWTAWAEMLAQTGSHTFHETDGRPSQHDVDALQQWLTTWRGDSGWTVLDEALCEGPLLGDARLRQRLTAEKETRARLLDWWSCPRTDDQWAIALDELLAVTANAPRLRQMAIRALQEAPAMQPFHAPALAPAWWALGTATRCSNSIPAQEQEDACRAVFARWAKVGPGIFRQTLLDYWAPRRTGSASSVLLPIPSLQRQTGSKSSSEENLQLLWLERIAPAIGWRGEPSLHPVADRLLAMEATLAATLEEKPRPRLSFADAVEMDAARSHARTKTETPVTPPLLGGVPQGSTRAPTPGSTPGSGQISAPRATAPELEAHAEEPSDDAANAQIVETERPPSEPHANERAADKPGPSLSRGERRQLHERLWGVLRSSSWGYEPSSWWTQLAHVAVERPQTEKLDRITDLVAGCLKHSPEGLQRLATRGSSVMRRAIAQHPRALTDPVVREGLLQMLQFTVWDKVYEHEATTATERGQLIRWLIELGQFARIARWMTRWPTHAFLIPASVVRPLLLSPRSDARETGLRLLAQAVAHDAAPPLPPLPPRPRKKIVR